MPINAHISRVLTTTILACAIALAAMMLGAHAAHAASVAFAEGGEIYVANTDGSNKSRVSGGEGKWRWTAQSDQGFIVGVQSTTGSLYQPKLYKVWGPDGSVVKSGSLPGDPTKFVSAFPIGLDLSPDGTYISYGYVNQTLGGSTSYGSYLLASGGSVAQLTLPFVDAASFYGNRILATDTYDDEVVLQAPGNVLSTSFTPWFNFKPGFSMEASDISANGAIVVNHANQLSDNAQLLTFSKWASVGAASPIDNCLFSPGGQPSSPSLSQNGAEFAWQATAGGVYVAGAPNLRAGGPSTCELTRPPVTISATGFSPSIGPFAPTNAKGGSGGGSVPDAISIALPKTLKLKTLKKGWSIKLRHNVGGKTSIKLTVKAGKKKLTIASASTTLSPNVAKTVKVRLNAAGKKLAKKLSGKKATVTIKIGARSSSKTIKLK
jgi:hypothetical protein